VTKEMYTRKLYVVHGRHHRQLVGFCPFRILNLVSFRKLIYIMVLLTFKILMTFV